MPQHPPTHEAGTARHHRRPWRRRTTLVAVSVTVFLSAALGSADAATSSPQTTQLWPSIPATQQHAQSTSNPLTYPQKVVDTVGDVTDPTALTHPGSGQSITLTRDIVGTRYGGPDSWPQGTTASASSTHAACCGVTFDPANALDANPSTYWNNATEGDTQSWLEISSPSPVTLPGITLDFDANGVPIDFEIQTWDATTSAWDTQTSVSGNHATEVARLFPAPVTTQNVRIYITLDEDKGYGQYSRVNEVYPFYSPPAEVVLDYGQEVEGWPEFEVTGYSGQADLVAGYSEALRYLTQFGDYGASGSPGVQDPQRYDSYPITYNGLLVNQFPQGGERYEMLSLQYPGSSVSLQFARLRYNRYSSSPSAPGGSFSSSDPTLDKIWANGAHTINLSQLPANTVGVDWVADNGALDVEGGSQDGAGNGEDTGILKQGAAWTNYTMAFTARILANQVGWAVRAQSLSSKYFLILDDQNDSIGPPNTLLEYEETPAGSFLQIGSIPLGFDVLPQHWYDISTTADGSDITTTVDGQQLATFDTATLPSNYPPLTQGTVGFRQGRVGIDDQSGVASASFKDLDVTGLDGATLYRDPLSGQSSVDRFQLPVENALPLMMADAKRDDDQGEWAGDLSVEGPTVYDAVGAPAYMKGAIEQLGSYQLTSGFVTGYEYPTVPVNTGPPIPGTVGTYSAEYSMYWVADLAQYYEYTGDKAFLHDEWPIVQRELAWNATQLNGQGLFVTDGSDGANWHYDVQVGAQTYYNIMYYRALTDAATLAAAVGDQTSAGAYQAQASTLKAAINQYLFNTTTGAYDISTTETGNVAQDANVNAILYGVAPAANVPGIIDALKTSLDTPYGALSVSSPAPAGYNQLIGPFMGSYEVWSLFNAGDTSDALNLIDQEWGPMTRQGPGDTDWESLGPTGSLVNALAWNSPGGVSLAHGWSTGPTSALSEYVLGIRPVAAGYQTWLVAPQPGTLSWAQGTVPTPHGTISVKWGRDASNGRFAMQVGVPSTTTGGTIDVPTFGKQVTIEINGRTMWSHGAFTAATLGIESATAQNGYVVLKINMAAVAQKSATSVLDITSSPAAHTRRP